MDRRIYENYVIQIAEYGSFTKAAANLGISQPALSAGLSSLEKDVGITIFNRKTVPVSFTPEGRIYFDYIKESRILALDFENRIRDIRESRNRCVSVGAPAAYAQSIVADAVIELLRIYPDFHIQIRTGAIPELMEMSADGRIDCFISTDEFLPDNFVQEKIKDELVYLVVPKDNPINSLISGFEVDPGNAGDLFDFSLLNDQSFIFLEDSQPLQKKASAFLDGQGVKPRCAMVVDQVSTAVGLSIKGAGICFASEEALEGSINLDSVSLYSLPNIVSGRSIFVARNKNMYLSSACKSLIQILKDSQRKGDTNE